MTTTTTGPLVFKLGGAALDDPAAAGDLWHAIAECHRALSGQLVLVHGGGILVDRHLERLGMTTERREGIRITPPEQVQEIAAVLAGRVNKSIVGALQTQALAAIGLCLGDGGSFTTRRADHYSFDPGRVGTVTGAHPGFILSLLSQRILPVFCSIGLDAHGSFLNVNADDAALAIASHLRSRGLVFLTDVPGILDADRRHLPTATPKDIESLIARGVISGGMIPKAQAAARAAQSTGIPAVIASFKHPADLPRLARGEPIGTRITPG